MEVYLNIVQMDAERRPPHRINKRNDPMSALTQLGRVFDATVAVAFVFISLSLAGATAVVGA